jgi:hypothetical protein
MTNPKKPPAKTAAARAAAAKAPKARKPANKKPAEKPEAKTAAPPKAVTQPVLTARKGPSEDLIAETILRLLEARGPGKTVCPSEVARDIGGSQPEVWSPMMQPVRRIAVRMTKAGQIAILRKGKPVEDVDDFRGIYRLALPSGASGDDTGSDEA